MWNTHGQTHGQSAPNNYKINYNSYDKSSAKILASKSRWNTRGTMDVYKIKHKLIIIQPKLT